MKRDMDKVRELLLKIEAGESESIGTESDTEDSHHLWLVKDAGFITSNMRDFPLVFIGGAEQWTRPRLTWEGAEFLDGIRDESSWSKVKDAIMAKGREVSFITIKAVVAGLVKQSFG